MAAERSDGRTTEVVSGSVADRTAAMTSLVRLAAGVAGIATGAALVAATRHSRAPVLGAGESMLFRSRPRASVLRWSASLGAWELVRRTTWFAVTDRRVLVEHGMFVRHSRSLPLAAIADVDTTTGLLEGVVHVAGLGGEGKLHRLDLGPLRSNAARALASTIVLAIARERRRVSGRR